ncbi:hypothetical protein [Yoonia sp. 2307UL14-13]|uniref:hypothetical protein n=1 Tax=Yoonia sp. 2307UL14-13 TaxID=3126506 RepID=UPI0030B2D87E
MLNFAPIIPARSDLDWCWYLRRHGKSGEALERILHDVGVMDPGGWAAWGRSGLTQTGSPVEMVFSAGEADLALVTEVADPLEDRADRVDQVCRIIRGYGGKSPDRALRDVISAAQGAGRLNYGARLGLRHGKKGLQTALVAELPDGCTDIARLINAKRCDALLDGIPDEATAEMLTVDGSSDAMTIHFSLPDNSPDHLGELAALAQVSPDVLAIAIDQLSKKARGSIKPTGFTYTITPGATAPILSLSFDAKTLFGTDRVATDRFKSSGGFFLTGYTALIDSLPPSVPQAMHHGRVELMARKGAAPLMSISVAAPWSCLFVE